MSGSSPETVPAFAPPTRWERRGLVALLVVILLYGGLVEFRGTFLKRRMTDLGVYLRAAWAVRTGHDIYTITDNNNWHYHYPPLLAILLTPLADPPPGADRAGMVPFGVSVLLWYGFSLGCLAAGVHVLAGALEEAAPDPAVRALPWGCRRWWRLRLLPVLVCLPAIAASLMRGQVDLLLLALLCAGAAALLRGQSVRAGLWLAGAICLKVIPGFLLVYPAYRRDYRCLAGCAAGLLAGMVVVPALALGPARTLGYYEEWMEVLLKPALAAGADKSRAEELIKVTRTDSQSFLAILHNTLHLDRSTRPHYAGPAVRRAHWLIGGLLTLAVLLAAGRRRRPHAVGEATFLGLLIVLMVLLSPVSHLHYFCLQVPLVMALVAARWERVPGIGLGAGLALLLAVNLVANTIVRVPGLELTRDVGVALYAALALGLAGMQVLRRPTPPLPLPGETPTQTSALAA